jgi:hypothetical protein
MRKIILSLLIGSVAFAGEEFHVESGPDQVNVLELYSSEGCSSCPPKEEWLAGLRRSPGLWTKFIPVSFHVDYWNHLGWTDRYSKGEFTNRQKKYASEWKNQRIYTPEFVLNGREWLPNPGDQGFTNTSQKRSGVLKVNSKDKRNFSVIFSPTDRNKNWRLYGALLANGLNSKVERGENQGRKLQHEFVVVELMNQKMNAQNSYFSAELQFASSKSIKASSYSAVFWVTEEEMQRPVQAAGGDLKE